MQKNIENKLTSTETGNLWTMYMSDSMAICVLKYFYEKVIDSDIKSILKFTLDISQKHIQFITKVFEQENIPIPIGFTDTDVDTTAPRLYSDSFFLIYLQNMSRLGMIAYSSTLALMSRSDIRKFYSNALTSSLELCERTSSAMISKEIFVHPPFAPVPEQIDFVSKKNFIKDWIGDKRPLTAIEAAHLFGNIQTNAVGKALIDGFSQVTKSKQLRQYMLRGIDIATNHIKSFSTILMLGGLSASTTWDVAVMNSTTTPFSDKLMMFHVDALIASGVGNYGASLAVSIRRDLQTLYPKLMAEIGKYAQDGADIMIEHAWLEQSPQLINHDALVMT
ncbi:MAG: DUF3231 family protein [Clostridia bacterium]